MGSIRTSIQMYDGVTATLQKIQDNASKTTQQFDNMNKHFQGAFSDNQFNAAKNGFDKIDNGIQQANNQQEKFNKAIQNSHSHIAKAEAGFKGWQKAIIVANQVLGLIRNTLGRLGVMNMDGAFDRIDTMNRFQKTVTVMTGDANMASAALANIKDNVLGTAYGLDVASKSAQGFLTRGMSLGASTNQVRIWADAVSFYGEGTNQQLESVVDAIGKMYSKGKVEADQLDRLFDAGIGAAEIYAKAVNKSVGSVKKDLSSGAISAANFINTVSQALDSGISSGAAKEAGNTWATTFANMRAAITRGWTSVITELDNALAQQGLPSSMEMVTMFGQKMEEILNTIADSMGSVIEMAVKVYNVMSTVGGFIVDNWSIISPVIWGVVAALTAYKIALVANNIVQAIHNFQKGIAVAAEYNHAKAILANKVAYDTETIAIAKATVAQASFNTTLLACPLTWIILIIITLISILYSVIAVINKFAGTSISATGIIAGSFLWLAALIGNTFIGVINSIIQNLWTVFVEPFIGIVEWILNVANGGFNSFGGAVANLIGQIISWFLSLGKVVTKIIDAIFGTNWTAGLSSLQDSVLEWGKNENAITLDRNAPGIDHRFDMTDSFGKGYEWGAKLFDDESNKNKGPDENLFNNVDMFNNIADTADNTGKIAKGVKISDEDLKYLHDVAEREAINRFTTAEIKVEMTNNNSINGTRDIDGIVDYLRDEVEEAMSRSAEGV
ncbi:tape measure protein [Anaerocolumna sp.]|uniref:tape measure protein n=1 Tax=Anaerocolumna sp. TaxID=2041569 RepID=UPI0028AD4703|nr:tape measure protein [Anaerocolumna sp.]